MKYIIFILGILQSGLIYCQQIDNTFKNDSSNIYNQSLKEFLQLRHQENKNRDTIFIDQYSKIADSITKFIGKVRVIKVTEPEIRNVVKNKKSLLLFRLLPLAYGHGEFWVSIIPFSKGYNRQEKKYVSSFGGQFRVFYKFNGATFTFDRIEQSEW